MVADKRKVEGIVRAVLKDIFGADRIGDIHVVRALGTDEDEILRIYVAVNGAGDRFDRTWQSVSCGICVADCWENSRTMRFR